MTQSKLESSRQNGNHQVDAQRESILLAAQTLFLRKGLEKTTMVDIAAQAGITKITLYRYFPNRELIAFQIWERMTSRLAEQFDHDIKQQLNTLKGAREITRLMISNFSRLQDVYRYIGMFDRYYLENPDNSVDKSAIQNSMFDFIAETWREARNSVTSDYEKRRITVILSTLLWYMGNLALRNEFLHHENGWEISQEEQLGIFEEMVICYLEHLIAPTRS